MWHPRLCNCILWALGMQIHYLWSFGMRTYVAFRPSAYGWWAHAMWSTDGQVWWEYTRYPPPKYRWITPPLFRGHVRLVDRWPP